MPQIASYSLKIDSSQHAHPGGAPLAFKLFVFSLILRILCHLEASQPLMVRAETGCSDPTPLCAISNMENRWN
jgi:hypothetical protein